MNDAPGDAELAQNQFATAVRNFTPKLPRSSRNYCRSKTASRNYDASARLTKPSPTSCATLTWQCRTIPCAALPDVLELTPRTQRPRKASAKALQHDSTGNPKANLVRKANTPQSDKGDRPFTRFARQSLRPHCRPENHLAQILRAASAASAFTMRGASVGVCVGTLTDWHLALRHFICEKSVTEASILRSKF